MRINKLTRKIVIYLTAIIMILMLGFSATYAWISSSQNTISIKIAGKIVQEYFHSGTGTEKDPFVITRPIHYYHLVEFFQRETEFELTDEEQNAIVRLFGTEFLYFQLGSKDMDKDGVEEQASPMVFAYDNSGDMILDANGNPTYTEVLNMAYYSGDNSLMPIGSSEVPFYGGFIGNNLTIDNLNIIASETVIITRKDEQGHLTYTTKQRSTSDIGIFGYVKDGSGAAYVYFDNVTINLAGTSASANGEDHTAHEKVYVGYLAGHVASNTIFIDTYINNCKIVGGNAASSGFAYFGRVDKSDGSEITSLKDTVQDFAQQGDDAGWGGSVDMYNMFKRVYTGYSKATNAVYPTQEVIILDHDGHIVSHYETATVNAGNNTFRWYYSEEGGSFYYKYNQNTRSWTDTQNNSYIYLSGNNAVYTKEVITYQYNGQYEDAYAIHSGDNYLSMSSSFDVYNSDLNNSSKWIHEDNTNCLYTMVPNPSDGSEKKHYLNRSGNNLILGETGNTAWTFEEVNGQKQIYTTSGQSKYYLLYNNGWKITNTDIPYVITDGDNNFLLVTLSGVGNRDNITNATKWTITSETGNTTFLTTVDGTNYYLGVDSNGLGLKTSAVTWYKDGNSYYCTYDGLNYYLTFDNEWTVQVVTGYDIYKDNEYLAISDTYSSVVTASGSSLLTLWQIEENDGNYAIYYAENGHKHYLNNAENGITLILTDELRTWLKDANGYYIELDGHKLYLTYDNGWKLQGIYEIGLNNNYLAHNSSTNAIYSTSTKDASIEWLMDNPLEASHIYYVANGIKYYLAASHDANNNLSGSLEIVTDVNNATLWYLDDSFRVYLNENDSNYYIGLNQGNWQIAVSWYAITDGSSHYLSLNANNDGITNASNATSQKAQWFLNIGGETTYIYSKVGNNTYYLSFVNGTLGVSSSPFTWNRDENGNYLLLGTIKYYLVYENGWTIENTYFNTISDGVENLVEINAARNGVNNTTTYTQREVRWQIPNSSGDTPVFYDDYGTKYYLDYNTQTLELTITSSESIWSQDENGLYKLIDNVKMYISFTGTKWKLAHWYAITDSNGHFLSLNNSKDGVTNANDATSANARWQMETTANGKSIFCEIGNDRYYLGLNNTTDHVGVLTISNTAYNWNATISDGAISAIYAGSTDDPSFLAYKGGWRAIKLKAYTIGDGSSHYFSANGSYNGITDTNAASATKWYFDSTSGAGRIATLNESTGQLYYLVANANGSYTFTTTQGSASTFEYASYPGTYRCSISGTYYYITYASETWIAGSNGWKCIPLEYLVSCQYSSWFSTTTGYLQYSGTTISMNTTKNNSTSKWTFSNPGTAPSGTIKNANNYYLTVNGSNKLELNTTSQSWNNSGTTLRNASKTNYYLNIERSGGIFSSSYNWVASTSSTTLTFTPTVTSVTLTASNYTATIDSDDLFVSTYVSGEFDPNISCVINDVDTGILANNTNSHLMSSTSSLQTLEKFSIVLKKSFETLYDDSKLELWDYKSTETKNSGRPTYIPLKAQLTNENDPASFYDDLRVDETNTGYIVSGGYSAGTSSADIRISKYPTSSLSTSTNSASGAYGDTHDANLQVLTRTINTNGYVRIKDSYNKDTQTVNNSLRNIEQKTVDQIGLLKYEQQDTSGNQIKLARAGLSTMLRSGGTYVFGLHFMNSLISTSHIITADKAVVNGQTYYNYELPESSIDFTLPQRGIINFFAGTYYVSTQQGNSYDNDTFFSLHEIFRDDNGYIIDIKELSKIYASDDDPKYIYQYAGNGGYSDGHTSLPAGYSLIFDLDWITNPNIIDYTVYYFEIPVNAGEFALGSVSGKDGAYLLYLDIAANAGEMVPEHVADNVNELGNLFKVDFRDATETVDYCIFQFAIDAPANAQGKFDVSAKFDPTQTLQNVYDEGLYIITINNTTSESLELTVFICDNDSDHTNAFPYAYQIVYNGEIFKNGIYDYWKSCETHTLE